MQREITHINLAKGFRGGERQTLLLIEELSHLEYSQTLIVREGSQLLKRTEHIKNLQVIPIQKPYIFSLTHLKNAKLIHAHETKALQLAYFAKLFYNIPYIVTRRVDNPIKSNFFNIKLYENASMCIALSHAITKTITTITQKANITVIPSAYTPLNVNKKILKEIKQQYQNKFLIGHIGALDDTHKGQSIIIQVAKELQKTYPTFHFLFIGDGKDKTKLQKLARNCSNITFVGFVDNIADYIAALDLFVFPSNNEGLGSILLDVMRLDVPIIASAVGGILDLIQHEKNGILIPPKNSQALKNAIIKIYSNPNLQKTLTYNAKKNIQKFSPSNMTKRYIKIYEQILQ